MPLKAVNIHMQHGHAQACVIEEYPVWIAAFIETSVYRTAISAQEQIRTVPPGLFEGRGLPPFGHFGVIPPDQDLRHLPSAKIGGPGAIRKIKQPTIRDF